MYMTRQERVILFLSDSLMQAKSDNDECEAHLKGVVDACERKVEDLSKMVNDQHERIRLLLKERPVARDAFADLLRRL